MQRLISLLRSLVLLRWLPRRMIIPVMLLLGAALGLGMALIHVSRATSYLSNASEVCVNCHVMRPHYASWRHSSHNEVASCNDCHVPHQTPVHSYAFKARDGIYHSTIFTLRLEPQVIHLSSGAVPVVQGNCVRCHEETISRVDVHPESADDHHCWDCHRDVPHGDVRSLSSTPTVMSPRLPALLREQEPTVGGRPTDEGPPEAH